MHRADFQVAFQLCNNAGILNMLTYPRSQKRDLGHPAGEQFGAVLEQITEPIYRTMVLMALCLGISCSKLFGLKWKDVLEDAIKIERAMVDNNEDDQDSASQEAVAAASGSGGRSCRMAQRHRVQLGRGLDIRQLVYRWRCPNAPGKCAAQDPDTAGERAGLSFSLGWHCFRHTYRSWLDELGVPLTVQRDLMRHSDIRTTANVYGRVGMNSLREAMSA